MQQKIWGDVESNKWIQQRACWGKDVACAEIKVIKLA